MKSWSSNPIDNLSVGEKCLGITSLFSMVIAEVGIHEYSHLLALNILFPNSNPRIDCDLSKFACFAKWDTPLVPSMTSLGYRISRGLMAAAGPLSDVSIIALLSIASWKMQRCNQKIALLFSAYAFVSSLNLFSYSLLEGGIENDCVCVESYLGIPRVVQAAIFGSLTAASTYLLGRFFRPL